MLKGTVAGATMSLGAGKVPSVSAQANELSYRIPPPNEQSPSADKDWWYPGAPKNNKPDLTPGKTPIRLSAWANNNLLNYPNPMKDSTTISYTITAPIEKMTVEIFTLSGRKIRSFTRHSLVPDYYDDIIWYGKDFEGDRVATEVYIYKATAYPAGGGKETESFGKIILVN